MLALSVSAHASEFEITADSFTVDNQVNLSSAAYFQGQALAPGNPAAATQLASPGGLYFDGTYYKVWNSQTGAWVQVATGTVEMGRVARAGDTMTGQLTLAGSTLTVTGNAFSIGGSTLVVASGNVGVATAAPAGLFTVGNGTFVVTSAGNVGIGYTTPPYPLSIASYANGGAINTAGEGIFNGSINAGNLLLGNASTTGNSVIGPSTTRDLLFTSWNGATNVEIARMTAAGNVKAVGGVTAAAFTTSTAWTAIPGGGVWASGAYCRRVGSFFMIKGGFSASATSVWGATGIVLPNVCWPSQTAYYFPAACWSGPGTSTACFISIDTAGSISLFTPASITTFSPGGVFPAD